MTNFFDGKVQWKKFFLAWCPIFFIRSEGICNWHPRLCWKIYVKVATRKLTLRSKYLCKLRAQRYSTNFWATSEVFSDFFFSLIGSILDFVSKECLPSCMFQWKMYTLFPTCVCRNILAFKKMAISTSAHFYCNSLVDSNNQTI